jgi:hypothetical protein
VFVASALSQYKDHRCLCAFVFFFGVLNVCVYETRLFLYSHEKEDSS